MSLYNVGSLLILIPFLLITMNPVINTNAINSTKYVDNYREYTLLISDVQEYYQASSVIIMHSGDDNCICVTTLMVGLIRELSTKFVLSQTFHFRQIFNYYDDLISRPLFVVFLNSTEEFKNFQLLTKNLDLSSPFWLVIFTQPELHFCYKPQVNYFNVLFDTEMMVKCYGDPTLREWYSSDWHSVTVDDIASWDLVKRLKLKTNESLYQRRNDLGGKILRIAMVKESPFIEAQHGAAFALYSEILDELSAALKFEKMIVSKEKSYGMYNRSSGQWSGAIGTVYRGDADIGIAEFTMTGERLDYVDFTLPIMLSRNHLYMRRPDGSAFQWSAYFQIYKTESWTAINLLHTLSWYVVTFINIRALIRKKPISPNHISENILLILGIQCQQGLPDFPIATSLRIAYCTILLSSVIYLSLYSASLISYLTIASPSLPFTTLEEFAKDGTYKLITFQDSADYNFFASSKETVLQQMMTLMLDEKHLPETTLKGFQQTCSSKIAFYATEAIKTQVNRRIPCDLVYIQSGRMDSLAMVLPKKSQFKGVINYHLQKFKDVGIMNLLASRAYVSVPPPDNKYNPVNARSIVTLLVILGIGILLSTIILICEILVHHKRNDVGNEKRQTKNAPMPS